MVSLSQRYFLAEFAKANHREVPVHRRFPLHGTNLGLLRTKQRLLLTVHHLKTGTPMKIRNFLLATMLMLGLTALASPAQAMSTWLPQFNGSQHVYVQPELATSARPFSVPTDYEATVKDLAKQHLLSTYVIVTQQGDDLTDGDFKNWARNMVRPEVYDRWSRIPEFDQRRSLILLVVRSKGGDHVSVAATSGDDLRRAGLDKDYFNRSDSPINKHVVQVRDQGIVGVTAILVDINAALDQPSQSQANIAVSSQMIIGILLVLIIVIVILCLISRGGGGGGGSYGGCSGGGCGGGGCGGGGGA